MASYEIKSKGLSIIYSDQNPKNRMFHNRIRGLIIKVEPPKWFNEIVSLHEIIKKVNQVLVDNAYVEKNSITSRFSAKGGFSYMYFKTEEDAMAFKLIS